MGKFYGPKYGRRAYQNVDWKYNFRPLLKWSSIILTATCLAWSTWAMRQEVVKKERIKLAKINAKEERAKYLKRKLETVKEKTIVDNDLRSVKNNRKTMVNEPAKPNRKPGYKIYTWVNEDGQTVYSNLPRRN